MRKILFLLIAIISIASLNELNAQPRSIGIRIGNNLKASYQHSLSDSRFLEVNVGLISYSYGLDFSASHNWMLNISVDKGYLNLYGGLGAGLGLGWKGGFNIGVIPQIGIEYIFEKTPIQLSLDYSPQLGINITNHKIKFNNMGVLDLGLAVRYMF